MSTFDSEEQPAILQLRRWCQFRPKLSNIQQVFISPSRRILVLLSYQYEALLISLEKDTVDDGFWGTRTDKFSHQDSSYSCLVDSDESVGWSSFPEGSKLSDGFPLCSNSHFEQFAFISDVKSLAWVHCEDTYLHEDSIFREVLVVSSDHGITVHAFTHLDTVTQGIDSLLETETFHGKWVEWGPHHYEQTNNNFNSGLEEGDHCGTCEATSNKTDQHVPRGVSSRKSNWLRTFRVEVEPSESEDNFVVSFPVRSSFPRSAKIVSFSIFDRILNIIESRVYKESHECGSISETPGFMAVHEDPVSYVLPKGSAAGSKSPTGRVLDCCTCKQYRCTRVFSSPSIHSIGLVLAHDVGSPGSASSKVVIYPDMLLIILAVSHSGLQWVCAMDFQEYCPRTSNVLEWVDFLFLQSYVICLNISGLVYICDAKTGSLILWVDVLHNCDASLKVDSELDQRMYPLDRNSSTVMENSAGEFQTNDFNKEGSHSESHCSRKRIFRRLLITPFSQVLAAIDEHGVMYLISLDECRLGTIGSCKFCPSFGDFGLGMFACQKVAEIEISRQETFSECLSDLYLSSTDFDGNFVNTNSNGRNKKRHYFQFKQGQMSSNISSTYSHNGSCNICHCKLPSAYTRRIFLPTNKFNVDDEVCFSPFGVVRLFRSRSKSCIVHSCLHMGSSDFHERDMNKGSSFSKEFILDFEAIGCCFQGFLYLVTKEGLAVVLPSSSLSCNVMERESISCWQSCMTEVCQTETTGRRILCRDILRPWQLEVLDKTLLYEGAGEAEELCTVNGWDIKIARIRRLELALYYMKVDEIERSLEMLADANLAEEGVLKLLLTSAYKIFCRAGSENEVATASRLLALSACFATKMVRRYGLLEVQKDLPAFGCNKNMNISMHLTNAEANNSRKLEEMACYLEVMRNMQQKLSLKRKKPTHGMVDYAEVLMPLEAHALKDESLILDSVSSAVTESSEVEHVDERTLPCSDGIIDSADRLALASVEHSIDICETDLSIVTIGDQKRILIPRENSRDMMTRWKVDNFDLKTVVKDALHSGRLPLAVLQLHLHHLKDLVTEEEPYDSFGEVRDVGRAIAYDLFLKGETGLAMTTLQRLGEDMEASLRQLLLGTVQKIIRTQVADEMKKLGYLKAREWLTLEKLSLVERLYPSSSFWRTYVERRKLSGQVISSSFQPDNTRLKLNLHMWISHSIDCDEIDGVVNGSWTSISIPSNFASIDEDTARAGYWACAAIWSDSWDLTTIDRIVLDQPLTLGIHVPWESKFTYHMVHNDWDEVQKLLDMIPSTTLSEGILRINLGSLHPDAYADGSEGTCYPPYIVSADYLGPTFIYIPNVKILKSSVIKMCSSWLKTLLEQELAKRVIFLKEYWESTTEIILLLASAGFISGMHGEYTQAKLNINSVDLQFLNMSGKFPKDTVEALHRLVIHHCAKHNLPNLMDLYLDHHKLALDSDSVCSLKEAAEGCHWAKWLLLSRAKGHEYDASFSNAGSIISSHKIPNSSLNHVDFDEIIHTVDDIAEGCGEIAALTTLMYAPLPIQKCLHYGSVSRHPSSSYQCTLENLRPGLQKFPTLWRALLTASLGYDADTRFLSTNYYNVLGKSSLSDYLNWRGNIFLSSGGDTSLVQMLPGWFPKSIRRLIKLFVEGPLGWEMLSGVLPDEEAFVLRENASVFNKNRNMTSIGISWEMAAQKRVEEELYSSLEVNKFSIEHHLHRGRALAAFNDLLSSRALKCKSTHAQRELSGGSEPSPSNIQSDVQMLLEPLTPDERSVISSVMPLAIMNFRESSLVSTCAFVLELFGLSASLLHINIAALRRISSYYKSLEDNPHDIHVVNKSSAFPAVPHESDLTTSLARALADNYLQFVNLDILEKKDIFVEDNNQQAKNLITVLQHLEIASLPSLNEGQTCGSWLKNGSGDGTKFRLQQKADSQNWTLVAAFCQMHHLPQSTKYLSLLAKDNDWVGFFIEGQQGGFPIDTVIQVADKEFSDPRLRMHILTVLRSMQSIRKNATSPTSLLSARKSSEISSMDLVSAGPVELFALAAECEGKKNPGQALLMKAKDLSWSLLAMIASCFPDVSPLSCLTVWLEISASRETSSLKVNDISSQITRNVRAAVEANNALPNSSRDVTFHYNRRNPKRRHKMEPSSGIHSTTFSNAVSSIIPTEVEASQMTASDRKRCAVADEQENIFCDPDELLLSLSDMVAMLCKQNSFLLLLRAFDLFLPLSSLVPFIRFLQAFSQMRLSEASAHLASFSARFKEDHYHLNFGVPRDGQISATWISSTAVKAADAVLTTCPSAYERRYLLKLLSDADFGDGGTAATWFQRQYWKINLAEPSLRADSDLCLGNEILDDLSLLTTLERNARWDQARSWAKQLESSSESLKSSFHHVTEMQAEALVAEWKEFLWDVPDERPAVWSHCQKLFVCHSFPPLQAGKFFLKHAEAIEKEIPARELHELLLLSLQWLSGMITQSNPVYPLHLLREIETRVWLLAVESETQTTLDLDPAFTPLKNVVGEDNPSIIDNTANIIAKMDNHINSMRMRINEKNGPRDSNKVYHQPIVPSDLVSQSTSGSNSRSKRRAKGSLHLRRTLTEHGEKNIETDETSGLLSKNSGELSKQLLEENTKLETSFSGWEERVRPVDLERAVLSLLEFGQVTAAKQLQQKLSPTNVPSELEIIDTALKLAAFLSPSCNGEVPLCDLDSELSSVIESYEIQCNDVLDLLQVVESLAMKCGEGSGRGLCRRIVTIFRAARVLGLSFSEAFDKQPIEILQLLSLKAQESLDEARLLVQSHAMPPASIARILAESFLKGLLAAHRGGYMDSQKDEGPSPLLWRLSDFLKWAELCPSEQEIGHALMRLVMTGQEIPHACEVELLILAHHFYKSSACLDGVDVLVALAANRVESYVIEGDFSCLARLVTGVSNFYALNFILGILIENGQLELLLQKYSAADPATGTSEVARGFRMAVLTALKRFNSDDVDAFAMVYNHFDMKHDTASLLESRSKHSLQLWSSRHDKDRQNADLLDSMRYLIEAADVYTTIDAGQKTHRACARSSLLSLQIRIPEIPWMDLSDTNARRIFVEQSRFQEALIVAEAYGLNQPSEWALVLWNHMLRPDIVEQFVADFVAILPLQPSMLLDLARFYRSEVAARGDQSQFSVWLSTGGLPAEWGKHLGKSFRCLLKKTRDLRVRIQLATVATGFIDVIDMCNGALDKVPETAGPLILRKGHGGAYLPLM